EAMKPFDELTLSPLSGDGVLPGIQEGGAICTDYTKYTGGTVIARPKNMTVEQLQAGYNRFTKDYYRMMEIVYRAFKQSNAVATITQLIANVRHRINCTTGGNIAVIIVGHDTHRVVFENMSLTERRYEESKVKTEIVKIKQRPDESYYNTGSCVHPLCVTGIQITFDRGQRFALVEWARNGRVQVGDQKACVEWGRGVRSYRQGS
ncbi:MAG: hypothetical protein ACYC5X_17920, partial [Syntrophales bacterium]